jgi:hypothetical protein
MSQRIVHAAPLTFGDTLFAIDKGNDLDLPPAFAGIGRVEMEIGRVTNARPGHEQTDKENCGVNQKMRHRRCSKTVSRAGGLGDAVSAGISGKAKPTW